jgi:thiosulfate/3-mercaptopyruvate sulfurtransferase
MFTTLIDVPTLQDHLNDDWLILDARHDLMDAHAGLHAYQLGHIPSAVFVSGEETVSGAKTGVNGRHPLPHPAAFRQAMQAIGLKPGRQVVVYDGGPGVFASRVWWMLRWIGHQPVAILDGGWARWQAHAGDVQAGQGVVAPAVAGFQAPQAGTVNTAGMPAVDVSFVRQNLGNDQWYMLDARSPERYRGESEPIDPVAGHIPGAFNRSNTLNLQTDGRFKPASDLANEFGALLGGHSPEKVIHQCGSGISACHNLFAMELAGLKGSVLYAGSWSEWCADPDRPVATASR